MFFRINKKKGFIAQSPECQMFDARGNLFYVAKKRKRFNLPPGRYFVKGYLKEAEPIDYSSYITIFSKEKNKPFLGIRKIFFVKNKNKCSIDISKGIVFFDKKFYKNLNRIQKTFVLLHELGHYFYFDERKCDNYARCVMLLMGYNPSQIYNVSKSSLVTQSRIANLKKDLVK